MRSKATNQISKYETYKLIDNKQTNFDELTHEIERIVQE